MFTNCVTLEDTMRWSQIIIFLFAFGGILFILFEAGKQLGKVSPRHLRTILYFFSLAAWLTCSTLFLARHFGGIDKSGDPHGVIGKVIIEALTILLNISGEASLILYISLGIIVPQFGCYILSGLYGHASNNFMFKNLLTGFSYIFLKSLVTVSGISITLIPIVYWEKWDVPHESAWRAIALTMLCLIFLIYAFGLMLFLLYETAIIRKIIDKTPAFFKRIVKIINTFFARNNAKGVLDDKM